VKKNMLLKYSKELLLLDLIIQLHDHVLFIFNLFEEKIKYNLF